MEESTAQEQFTEFSDAWKEFVITVCEELPIFKRIISRLRSNE